MSVIRVEKTKNYTVMANHHLRNAEMSLKAKGLLSQMLSLPEDWDYTVHGLTTINKESDNSIRNILKELEQFGYLDRKRIRNKKGQIVDNDYTIYEIPRTLDMSDFHPIVKNPLVDNPRVDNVTQLSTELLSTESIKKHIVDYEKHFDEL